MENYSYEFFILTFPTDVNNTLCISIIFVLIYLAGVLANAMTIIVIYIDRHLHTPMYLFLCNLSIIDLCYITTTVPKLIYMFLSGNYILYFTQCFTQMYFFGHLATTEDLLLCIMAYDRYAAMCNHLHYHNILNKKKCILFMSVCWVSGFFNSSITTFTLSRIPLCYSNSVPQFFCEFKAFEKIACPNAGFQLISYLEAVIFGLSPLLGSIISYVKIITVILHIKSSDGRSKAFSTCSSHLIVITMCYGTFMFVYIMPPLKDTRLLERTFSVFYATIIPILNPLVYSIRNKDVNRALLKIVRCKARRR